MSSEKEIQAFIGTRIHELREEKHLTQDKLAELSGIKNTTISAYENHKKTIGLYNLSRIAKAFGVTIDELYYGSEETAPIRKAGADVGKKITNCVFELYKENVIYGVQQDMMDDSYEFDVVNHYRPLYKFLSTLSQVRHELDSEDPEQISYIEQAKSMAAFEINSEIREREARKNFQFAKQEKPTPNPM